MRMRRIKRYGHDNIELLMKNTPGPKNSDTGLMLNRNYSKVSSELKPYIDGRMKYWNKEIEVDIIQESPQTTLQDFSPKKTTNRLSPINTTLTEHSMVKLPKLKET